MPVKGEHLAWMESSAVVYANSVLGARTNVEGRESTGAASITGRIPYWGLHDPANRRATQLVEVEIPVDTMMDWGLMGYWIGEAVMEEIPVLAALDVQPRPMWLKHFGAAAASSGGVEMYHIPGVTPEAASVDEALGGRAPARWLRYGEAERRQAWERLNGANGRAEVDFVMLGCPHNSAEQMWHIAALLEGRKVSPDVALWVHTPRQIRHLCDESGITDVIEAAGGLVMSDSCPAINRAVPDGHARDRHRQLQAGALPARDHWGPRPGSARSRDCVDAAVTGRFAGRLQ